MGKFSQCGPSGGLGGKKFDDGQTGNRTITEVRIHSGAFIDSIQVVYVDGAQATIEKPRHGGNGGKLKAFKLAADEYITAVGGKHGWYVDSLWITTNKENTMKWGGKGGAHTFVYQAPPGTRVDGFWGHAAKYVDALGVYILTP